MSEHILTRQRLQSIPRVSQFEGLLAESTLSDEDKEILRMHYLHHKDFRYIADFLGYAEITIKKRHSKALKKLNKLF